MSIRLALLIVSTVSLSLVIASCSHVKANQFTCEQPKVEVKPSQFSTSTIKGELRVDNDIVPLNHIYVFSVDRIWDNSGLLEENETPKEELLLIATESEIPANVLQILITKQTDYARKNLLDSGLKGLWLTLRDKENTYRGNFLYPPTLDGGLSFFNSYLEPENFLRVSNNQLSGEISGSAKLSRDFQYKFSFKSPIQPNLLLRRVFSNQAAFSSPPVNLYRAFLSALNQRNLEQMRLYLNDKNLKTLNIMVSEMGSEKFFSEFNSFRSFLQKSDYSQQEAYASKIGMEKYLLLLSLNIHATEFDKGDIKGRLNQVLIRGGEAIVVLQSGKTRSSYSITCENGTWKL